MQSCCYEKNIYEKVLERYSRKEAAGMEYESDVLSIVNTS